MYNSLDVFEVGEDVHVSETVDGHQREVVLALPEVVEGMGKQNTVCRHRRYGPCTRCIHTYVSTTW